MTIGSQTTDTTEALEPAFGLQPGSDVESDARVVWWLLGGWFVVNLAACLVFAIWISPLGFGSIPYLLFGGPVVVAQFGFAAIWMWLGDDSRLARFADIPMGMALLMIAFVCAIENQVTLFAALFQIVVAESLPLVLLNLRGARITRRSQTDYAPKRWLRFSIADLLIATTGLAVLLGLGSIGGQVLTEVKAILFFSAPTWLVALLAFRGRAAYGVVCCGCLLFGAHVILTLLELDPLMHLLDFEIRILLLMAGIQLLALTAAATVLRMLGFRLRFVDSAGERPAARIS